MWLYCAELLDRFDVEMQKKRAHLASDVTSAVATAKMVELGYELLSHPRILQI